MKFACYDIEVFPTVFTCVFHDPFEDNWWVFEHSERKNQVEEFKQFLHWLRQSGTRMVGYNNAHFDYPCIHGAMTGGQWGYKEAYEMCDRIISAPFGSFPPVSKSEWLIPQVDLFLLMHFNNKSKRQSLKGLELAMRMEDVRDIPITPGQPVPLHMLDELIRYNVHDVKATSQFFLTDDVQGGLKLRDELSAKYNKDFTNFSDVKMGVEVLTIETDKMKPGSCYDQFGKPRQTKRSSMALGDILLDSVEFEHSETCGCGPRCGILLSKSRYCQ